MPDSKTLLETNARVAALFHRNLGRSYSSSLERSQRQRIHCLEHIVDQEKFR
jgi:hypothetical protein